MEKLERFLFLSAFLGLVSILQAQSIQTPYEVAVWRDFRTVAVSFTFDDNCPNQLNIAVPMFNEYGYKLTLFTVTGSGWGWPANWKALRQAALEGHEVAAHTVTHQSFSGMPDSLQIFELEESLRTIDRNIPEVRCATLAYPFCVPAKKSLCEKYYIAARICSGSIVSNNPSDFMNISSIICGDQGPVRTGKDFYKSAKSALKAKGWCVFLLHGIDNDGGWSPVDSRELRAALDSLKTAPNDYWVESFGTVARYIYERKSVQVRESAATDSTITLQVTDALNDSIFNVPLTLRRPLPEGWPAATVSQNGVPVPFKIVEVSGTRTLQFDAVPDAGDVVICKSEASAVHLQGHLPLSPQLRPNHPNPFNPSTVISFELPSPGFAMLKIYNLHGRAVRTLVSDYFPAGEQRLIWDGRDDSNNRVSAGVYLYQLEFNGSGGKRMVLSRKMSLLD
ncbi:MAG: polysaccharide deacetylase family protein [candidate division KSB1 bacterium]|nr:polysaccharide deacetylase family protein [candidate division KSB1 bacterium]